MQFENSLAAITAAVSSSNAPRTKTHLAPPIVGPENTVVDCHLCGASVRTSVKYTNNSGTYLSAALWGFCCLCCIPFLFNGAKNTDHYCPRCMRYLGTYRRM